MSIIPANYWNRYIASSAKMGFYWCSTNRNWITWLLRRVCGKTHYDSWLGDVVISYGRKSIERLLVEKDFQLFGGATGNGEIDAVA